MGEANDSQYLINWDETCYLPPDYLISEESFNTHTNDSSYYEYSSLFSGTEQMEFKKEKNVPVSNIQRDLPESSKPMPKVHTRYQFTNPQPRGSGISNQQRKFYHWYMKQVASNKNPGLVKANTFKFKQLMQRVVEEQADYQNFLRNCAHSDVNEYVFLASDVREFFLDSYLKSMMDVLEESQEENYSLCQTIQMQPVSNTATTFHHISTVVPQKYIPALHYPPLHSPMKFKMDPFQKQKNLSVENIESVCIRESVDIYMSSSALVVLMESFVDLTVDFIIPVTIKTVSGENDRKHNILMFLDPFPRRQMSSRDVNSYFYTNSLKRMIWNNAPDHTTSGSQQETVDCSPSQSINKFQCGNRKMLVGGQVDCDNPLQQTFKLFTKIEYQPSIGYEQISLSDYCQSWWSSMCCNANYVLLTRIDPRNDCITRVDSYSRDVLCAPGCPYQPQLYFNHLEQLLTKMKCLQATGEYFLEHASGNNQLFLFQRKEQGLTTLATKYKDFITKKKEMISESIFPWLPVDTNILVPEFQGIPWLFDSHSVHTQNSRRGRSKHTARKKKGSAVEESEHLPHYIRLGKPVVTYGKSDELDLF